MTTRTIIALVSLAVTMNSCDTTTTIFKSSKSKTDYWKLNSFTMSHCGCTELFAEIYSGGLHTAQIWYATDFARKNIFKHNDKGIIIDTLVFVATQTEPEIEFNQLDKEILKVIKDKIESNNGIAYEMKWTDYKGFTKKD